MNKTEYIAETKHEECIETLRNSFILEFKRKRPLKDFILKKEKLWPTELSSKKIKGLTKSTRSILIFISAIKKKGGANCL